jgi:LmbE family N-acetylglucosaminyl deacetylase
VLSPHLDDAALSLGATIAGAVAAGNRVTALTVFANDPADGGPASDWDRRCGFATAHEAAVGRRREDERACALLGATPVWMPFADREYTPRPSGDDVWEALWPHLLVADQVLLPGFPLENPDHAWLHELVSGRVSAIPGEAALYVEQHYATALLWGRSRRGDHAKPWRRSASDVVRFTLSGPGAVRAGSMPPGFGGTRPALAAVRAKHRAIGCYRSQLRRIGPLLRPRIALYEVGARGEAVAPLAASG